MASSVPDLQDFTSTFVLTPTPTSNPVLFQLPQVLANDASRQRRAHQKSSRGCERCKRRRVKCNEERPCANCIRRRETCQQPIRHDSPKALVSMTVAPKSPVLHSGATNAAVDLQHMKLFHHFQTSTRQTLVFATEVWDYATQLSFSFDFVMNAMLCLAARHLSFLQPDNATYPISAAKHLSHALSGFRHALSGDLAAPQYDVFVATSILLQFELWIDTDCFSSQSPGLLSYVPSTDCIFTFSSIMTRQVIGSFPPASVKASSLMPFLQYGCVSALDKAVDLSASAMAQYHQFFSSHRPLQQSQLDAPLAPFQSMNIVSNINEKTSILPCGSASKSTTEPIAVALTPAVSKLSPLLSILPVNKQHGPIVTEPSLLPKIASHALFFPIMCRGLFASMVSQSNPHALLLLYHFYRAIKILLHGTDYWWAQKRPAMMEKALKTWLDAKCTRKCVEHGNI